MFFLRVANVGQIANVMKRVLDLLIVVPSLIMLSPLMLAIALGIKFTSSGPVLFRQQRVGRYGRHFKICKFRTMVVTQAGAGPQVTASHDPRITPLGRILRDLKLDELPQLFNVLRGDMTLVGPRPQVPRFVQHYPQPIRELVLSVRPGITDPATLAYRNEEELLEGAADPERSYIDTILPHKLRMYVQYLRHRTLATDVVVILTTVACVLARGPSKSVGPAHRTATDVSISRHSRPTISLRTPAMKRRFAWEELV
jgi:lipopolysaccharide/colanic/teichoic acid biosynthesis glycosyltransferase